MSVPNLVFDTPLWLSLFTTGVAATEGAVIGRQGRSPRYDIVGIFVLAVVLGLAGGIARDLLIGNTPVVATRTPWYIVTVIGVTLLVIVAGRFIPPLTGMWFILLDALTLGLYTAIGTGYALQAGVSVVGAVFVGVVAGSVGGVIVGLLQGRTPAILVPGVFYVITALVGSIAYVCINPWSSAVAAITCVGLVLVLRALSVHFNLGTKALPVMNPADGEDSPGTEDR